MAERGWGRRRWRGGPWRFPVALLLACALALPAAADGPAPTAARPPEALVRGFLATRDAAALEAGLRAGGREATDPWCLLAHIAARGVDATVRAAVAAEAPAPGAGEALVRAVVALHDVDLRLACAALRCSDMAEEAQGVATTWAGALLLARRGDDSGAVGRLLGPTQAADETARFELALLALALPSVERGMLAEIGRLALARAAERSRFQSLGVVLDGVLAVDPTAAAGVGAQVVRALRRAGRPTEARAWLERLPRGVAALDIERALLDDDPRSTTALLAPHAQAPGLGPLAVALPRRAAWPLALRERTPLPHATGARKDALLLARLASLQGHAATVDGVLRQADRAGTEAGHAAFAATWLASLDLVVLRAAGDPEMAARLADAGVPFLLWRIQRVGPTYRERPVLVRGRDAASGLYWVDEPDMALVDVLPAEGVAKARLLAAVPRASAAVLDRERTRPSALLGARLEAVRAQVDVAPATAAALLEDAGDAPIVYLHRALSRYEGALAAPTMDGWVDAAAAVARSAAVPPRLAFEAFLAAQAAAVGGDAAAALAALELTERLEGPSASLHLVRHAALEAAGRHGEALQALDAAQRADALDPRPLLYRGSLRDVAPEVAQGDLRRAMERAPEDPRAAVALALLLARLDRRPEALDVLRVARRHARNDADLRILDRARQQVELRLIEEAESGAALSGFERSADPSTRRRAAFQLAALESAETEVQLRGLLLDPDADVRITVLRLYLRPWLRRRVAEDTVLGRRVVTLLEADRDPNVRSAAAKLLGYVDEPFARRALADRLRGRAADAEPSVRASAALALRGRAERAVREALVAALADPVAAVRQAACDVLFEQAATRLGFEAQGRPQERAEAIRRWRRWVVAMEEAEPADPAPRARPGRGGP